MEKSDLKAGDKLIDFQKGYAREFLIVESDNDLFLAAGTIRQKIEDSLSGGILLIRTEYEK